jgi:hypothetical protein
MFGRALKKYPTWCGGFCGGQRRLACGFFSQIRLRGTAIHSVHCASRRPAPASSRYPPRLSNRYPPRLTEVRPTGAGSTVVWVVSFAGLIVLPRPLDKFANTTPGPYELGGKRDAVASNVNVIVVPSGAAVPKAGVAVSHEGVLIEYLTVPTDVASRYWKTVGENGPPRGPEKGHARRWVRR